MRMVQELSVRFDHARILFYLPSALVATTAFALAVFVLLTNHRRRINQMLALCMGFFFLWEGGSAMVWLSPNLFIKVSMLSVPLAIYASTLLRESILAPWRSMKGYFFRTRYQGLLTIAYLVALVGLGLPPFTPGKRPGFGPMFWTLSAVSTLWFIYLFGHSLYLLRSRKVLGIARSELSAFIALLGSALIAGILGVGFRYIHIWTLARTCPVILLLGLVYFTALMVRQEIFDSRDLRKAFLSSSIRGLAYLAFGLVIAVSLPLIGVVSGVHRVMWTVGSVLVLLILRVVERRGRQFLNPRNLSSRLLAAQADANELTERVVEIGDLQAQYCNVLRGWADGSPEVFLSDAVFTGAWPSVPIPPELVLLISDSGWTTPEILDREGTRHEKELAFMVENQVAALVCSVSLTGEKLIVAFKTRDSQRPFVTRELREARELLRTMQFGLGFVRMRQKLRGNDRLNFYAQYAPQFAHELRNGLYCQSLLLHAIAEGRTAEVRMADAKAGLERIEQVHRLCDHFFSMGALFKRPVQIMHLREALVAIVDQARVQFADKAKVQVEIHFKAPVDVFFLANPDSFGMAVNNLLKNGVEAVAGREQPGFIKVTAEKSFESVHVLVGDNGPGLPEDRKADPFAPGISHKPEGHGLGLSIVRDCIEAMGGTIGVRTSSLEGTCFEIALRCAEASSDPVLGSARVEPAAG